MIRSKSADPFYRFIQDGKAGYINRAGKIVIKPQIEFYGNNGYEFQNGLLHPSASGGQYLNTDGKLVIDKNYSSAWDFSEGLAAAVPENGEKWGYIDVSGEFVISPRFDSYPKGYVSSFSGGLAMIEVAKKYGYINRSGEFVIRPKFLYGADFHQGMARVVVEGPCVYFESVPCLEVRKFGGDADEPVGSCKFTFIDKSGSVISAGRYEDAMDFSEGLAPVKVGDKWGYIDTKGRMVIEPKFDEGEMFSDGLARVRLGELYGYIGHSGAFLIPPQFTYAQDFAEGLAVVGHRDEEESTSDEVFFINKQGRQAIAQKFALASHFFKGLAHVKLKSDNKRNRIDEGAESIFAYIDARGRKVFTYTHKTED